MLKYVRVPVSTQILTNTGYEMSGSFADITGVTSCTQKFIHNKRSEIEWDRILNTKRAANFKRTERNLT